MPVSEPVLLVLGTSEPVALEPELGRSLDGTVALLPVVLRSDLLEPALSDEFDLLELVLVLVDFLSDFIESELPVLGPEPPVPSAEGLETPLPAVSDA